MPKSPVPMLLWVAALLLLGEALSLIVLQPLTLASVSLTVAGLFLMVLLLRRSRVAWVLLIFGSALQIVGAFAWGDPYWLIVPAGAMLICLMAPSSRQFIWDLTERRDPGHPPNPLALYTSIEAAVYSAREKLLVPRSPRFVDANTICALVIIFFIAIPIMGRFTEHREDADSLVIDVVWRAFWIPYNLLPLAIVGLSALLIYRKWKLRDSRAMNQA